MKKLVLGVSLLAASVAGFAGEGEVKDRDGFYGTLGLYNVDPDTNRGTADNEGWGASFGYLFNKNWGLEAQYTDSNHKVSFVNGGKVGFDTVGLDLVYNETNWIGNTNTFPFVKLGFGEYNLDYSGPVTAPFGTLLTDFENEDFFKVGLGAQHYFSDNFFGRIGYDLLKAEEDDAMWYVTLGAFFGNTHRTAAPAPVAPVVKAPKDSDGDGVIDANDRCPGTPAGAKVDSYGCPVDSDGDGVYDYQDACPGTPAGAKVDDKGCRIKLEEEVVIDMRLNFDTNKAAIKTEMVSEISKVAEFMRQYPDVNAEIQGHTDSVGKASYNKSLSQRRADSVVSYMVSNFGIDASRLSGVGFGEERPIADNATKEGRAQNRRAEAHLATVIQK